MESFFFTTKRTRPTLFVIPATARRSRTRVPRGKNAGGRPLSIPSVAEAIVLAHSSHNGEEKGCVDASSTCIGYTAFYDAQAAFKS